MKKERIDKLLHERGLAESRSKAQALVMSGVVLVNERRVEKPSETFEPSVAIRIKHGEQVSRYVGRGGFKLEAALDSFRIDPQDLVCLDVGSSTGGFTDCLLQRGARSVIAVDVGTNQLDWKLRTDDRVEVRERTNARGLTPADFVEPFDLIVMDVSFISVRKILPALVGLLAETGTIVVLIKPQFEVGRTEVGKGGIVREDEKHDRVISEINSSAEALGLEVLGTIPSPITGAEGNREFLSCYKKARPSLGDAAISRPALREGVDYYLDGGLMVLTEKFLTDRGYCCDSGCRHCPYPKQG